MLITVFVFLESRPASTPGWRADAKMRARDRDRIRSAFSRLDFYGVMPQSELAAAVSPRWPRCGIHCRTLGIDFHPRRRDRLGARCVPRVDADGCRSSLHTRHHRRYAEVPGAHQRHGAPMPALVMAAGLISLLLVALLFTANALDFMLDLTAALSPFPISSRRPTR